MTSQRHQKLKEIVYSAADVPLDELDAFLKRACGDDRALFDEARAILGDETLDTVVVDPSNMTEAIALLTPELPTRIGRYEIISRIGEGGMGTVFEAQQDTPRRRVAVKVVRSVLLSRKLLTRFRNETELLGRLQHPGIAQVYDAGVADIETSRGRQPEQPYFAMELVDGVPLTDFIRNGQLAFQQRLDLVARIADAVQYAHQRGVIHRDLKPGNILVARDGQPKILDFGVARATDGDLAAVTQQTDTGQIIGTLAYMSPEQIVGDSAAIDTRSDVYALGVILFEVLAGRLPFDLRQRTLVESARIVQEQEPPRLSVAAGGVAWRSLLKGDVEVIVGKALSKDKVLRYPSAGEFAADLRRLMADEPILARPPTTSYQLRKFARRNRTLVVSVALVALALAAGTVIATWQAVAARRAQREAEAKQRLAENVTDFFNREVFTKSSPELVSTTRPTTIIEAMDGAAVAIDKSFQDEPLVRAAIHNALGYAYRGNGFYHKAQGQLEQGLELLTRYADASSPDTTRAQSTLATVYRIQRRYELAEPLFRTVLAAQTSRLGANHPDTLETTVGLGLTLHYLKRDAEGLPMIESALARQQRTEDKNKDVKVGQTMNILAAIYASAGRVDDAEKMFLSALDVTRRACGEDHADTLACMSGLGDFYVKQGKPEKAIPLLSEACDRKLRLLGPAHPNRLSSLRSLAAAYAAQKDYRRAEPLYREASREYAKIAAADDYLPGATLADAATCQLRMNRLPEAETTYLQAYAMLEASVGQQHSLTRNAAKNLAALYEQQGKTALVVQWRSMATAAAATRP